MADEPKTPNEQPETALEKLEERLQRKAAEGDKSEAERLANQPKSQGAWTDEQQRDNAREEIQRRLNKSTGGDLPSK